MSSQKTTQRRLSWLAGSSLIAASLATAAFTTVTIAPAVAFAADECTPVPPTLGNGPGPVSDDPTLNGAAADTFACTVTPYATGITYSSAGDLTVAKTNTGTTTVTANGVNLTGNGADSVTWDSSLGTVTGGSGTGGPVIDVTTDAGEIDITTASVSGTQAGITHGIRATSTGGGDITISRSTGFVTGSNATSGDTGIQATTSGGDIAVTTAGGTTSGRLRGIAAQTSGSGTITLNIGESVTVNNTSGVVAIDTAAGTGATAISITGGTVNGGAGLAIRSVSAGAVSVHNTGGAIGASSIGFPSSGGAVDFSGVTGGGVTFVNTGATSNSGRWMASGDSVFSAGADTLTMSGVGENFLGGGASIDLGAGADTFNMSALFSMGDLSAVPATLDFGSGTDTFNMSGVFSPGPDSRILNLENFNNSGVIYLGGGTVLQLNDTVRAFDRSNGEADDVLGLQGVTFTGSGDSRIVADIYLDDSTQAGCDTATGAGDCLDLRGGASAGSTLVTLNTLNSDASLGAYNPVGVTVVDVGGGTSAAEHFTLDPNSAGYVVDPAFGGVISRPGLFVYALRYDPDTQRHVVAGLPRSETLEYGMLSSAAQSIWHMTTETVTDRQSDLRGAPEGGALWMRTTGEYTKRDVAHELTVFGDSFVFDQSYKLYAGTIIGGLDLIQGRSGDLDYVVGAQIGYVGSSFDLENSPSSGRLSGATGGLYGSIWNQRVFLDATFNMNGLTLDYDSPGTGTKTNTYTTAFGGRLEGGMRWALSEVLFAEPLATVSFVRTSFEEISLFGGEARPDDAQSRRAALGLRLGGDIDGQIVNWSYYLTGRAWNEFDGESGGVVNNPGLDLPFVDEFDGTFGQVEAGLSLYNDANTLSGFASTGVKFTDGYSALDLSLGLRMAW